MCRKQCDNFLVTVNAKLGPGFAKQDLIDEDFETPSCDLCGDDADGDRQSCPDAEAVVVAPKDGDEHVNAEVSLEQAGVPQNARVAGRKWQSDGTLQGPRNTDPMLDARTCEVEFPGGEVAEHAASVVAENMWAQCDLDGHQRVLLDAIVDCKVDGHAIKMADRFIVIDGKRHLQKTAAGWHLCLQWKDGSAAWSGLADAKESHPVEVAEFAVAQGIDHEPAFAGGCLTL